MAEQEPDKDESERGDRRSVGRSRILKAGLIGTILTALCCFTPVLVVLFAALGLTALVGYLDFVLFPLLAVFVLLLMVGLYRKYR